MCVGIVTVIGFGGYALLANIHYGVAVESVFSWMLGAGARPEAAQGTWGNIDNLTGRNLCLTALNHLSYAVVIPGVENTRSIRAFDHYPALGYGGLVAWAASLVIGLVAAIDLAGTAAHKDRHVRWVLALVAAWTVPRMECVPEIQYTSVPGTPPAETVPNSRTYKHRPVYRNSRTYLG